MKKTSKWMLLVAILLVGSLALAGCGGGAKSDDQATGDGQGEGIKGTITVAGSTSVQPLSDELAKAFKEKNPEATINVQGGGSSQGVKAANDGIAQIGASSRELSEEEKQMGIEEHVIAIDGIGVAVNPQNDVSELTVEQVRKIYAGEITNWKDVGGKDAAIAVVTREAGSGTRGAFEELVMGEDAKITDRANVQPSNGGVRQAVAGDPNAIGYLSLGYMNEQVKGAKIDGVEPTVENIKAGTYKIKRPFIYLTKGEVNEVTKAYIDFVLSGEGQEIVGESYIKVIE